MTGPLWAWELAASCRFEAQGLPFNPFCLLSALLQGRVNFRFSGRDVAVFLHPILFLFLEKHLAFTDMHMVKLSTKSAQKWCSRTKCAHATVVIKIKP